MVSTQDSRVEGSFFLNVVSDRDTWNFQVSSKLEERKTRHIHLCGKAVS